MDKNKKLLYTFVIGLVLVVLSAVIKAHFDINNQYIGLWLLPIYLAFMGGSVLIGIGMLYFFRKKKN